MEQNYHAVICTKHKIPVETKWECPVCKKENEAENNKAACANCKHIADKNEYDTGQFRLCQRFEHDEITEDEAYIDSGDFAASSADLWVKDNFFCKFFENK